MKSSSIIISVYFLLASLFASAQTDEPVKGRRSPITKGYYSISNTHPVGGAATLLAADTGITVSPAKGYLSIQAAAPKIKLASGWLAPKQKRPAITKGYYSIGDHMERFPGASKQ